MGRVCVFFFFFNDTATTEIYTLSLHDALPISAFQLLKKRAALSFTIVDSSILTNGISVLRHSRSEEHTSELQSLAYLVCRLLLEKKKTPSPTLTSLASFTTPLLCSSSNRQPTS